MTVAIITGASRGLGRALAGGLADAGWRLVVDGRDADDGRCAAVELPAPGGDRRSPGDVTDAAHRPRWSRRPTGSAAPTCWSTTPASSGRSPQPPLADYPLDALREVFEVNVRRAARADPARPAGAARARRRASSTSPRTRPSRRTPGWGGYGSAKAALEQASRVLAAEEPDVRVWWVDPGDLRTRMHQEAFPGEDISDRPLPETVVPAFLRLLADAAARRAGSGSPTC